VPDIPFLPDLSIGGLLDGVFDWMAERVVDTLGWLMAFLTNAFFTSPDVTVLPQVQALAQRSTLIVQSVYGLAILTAGVVAMTHASVQIRYSAKELLPRLVFGFLISGFALALCSGLIEAANALTVAMVGDMAAGPRVVQFVSDQLKASTIEQGPPFLIIRAVLGLLIVILLFQVIFGWVMRVTVLLILAGISPIAVACYALPWTEPVTRLWWRSLLGALAVPMLQGAAFAAVIDLVVDPDHALPAVLRLPASNLLNLLIVAALLMVTIRIPRLVAQYAGQGRGMSAAGVVVRTVVTQAATRAVPVPGLSRIFH